MEKTELRGCLNTRYEEKKDERYRITGPGFLEIVTFLKTQKLETVQENDFFIEQSPMDKSFNQRLFSMFGLLDTVQLLSFEVLGDGPEIFVQTVIIVYIHTLIILEVIISW